MTSRHARLLRLIPAALAAYELRYLIVHLMSLGTSLRVTGSRPVTLWAFVLLAAAAGSLLRESGRGLVKRLPRPGWSRRFVGSWVLCSVVLAALLVAASLVHVLPAIGHGQPPPSVAAGLWSGVPTVALIGLLLAASLYGARWLLLELARVRHRPREGRPERLALGAGATRERPAPAPLRAGWSGRGPPAAALTAS